MTINLKIPHVTELKPRITVFGVGGAGGNAVNNMIQSRLEGVEFVVANTDAQALAQSAAERRIQMGVALTEGLGAGSQPQIGAAAAEEALPEIIDHLSGSHMVFITAGMGGGTGTGAAPVIARASREQGILTVGVVTKPFHFEGQRRMATAERGIEQLTDHVDTLIIIPNQNLFRVANEKTTFADAFAMADQVLYSGVAGITDLMVKEGLINLDFADVRAVMSEMGKAMMGTGEASGEKRAVESAEAAISNPLLDEVSMRGARGLLINITGGPDLTLYEVDEAATRIREEVDPDANIILGATFDDQLEGIIRVSVVATGIQDVASESAGAYEAHDQAEPRALTRGFHGFDVQKPATRETFDDGEDLREPARFDANDHHQSMDEADHRGDPADADERDNRGRPGDYDDFRDDTAAHGHPQAYASSHAEMYGRVTGRPRMPSVEDFPPIAQREIAARRDNIAHLDVHAQQRQKRGFLERLANMGLGVRQQPEVPAEAAEPSLRAAESPQPQYRQPPQHPHRAEAAEPRHGERPSNVHPIESRIDPDIDDEQLEIPAFLRRQAN